MNETDAQYYDAFGRLSSITVNDTSNARSYTYDRWGNRLDQAGNGGQPNLTFNANNQVFMNGYTYDAAGNMTSDGVNCYSYDAEGNVTQVYNCSSKAIAATYIYNALNQRVSIDQPGSPSLEFLYNPAGQHTSRWKVTQGGADTVWTWWGADHLSFYYANTTEFSHKDWLGTERYRTNVSAQPAGEFTSLPFGDAYTVAYGVDWDVYHYATLDQDNSANEHAQFREYSNMAGRWFSPDPYQGSYDPTNPQSFNRYAYALNNPLTFIDPLGLCVTPGVTFCIDGWAPYPTPGSGGGGGDPGGINGIFRQPNGGSGNTPNNNQHWYSKYTNISVLSPNHCVGTAARTMARDYAIGEGVGAGVGTVIGGLIAAGFTAETDTYPLAGTTVPAGMVGGAMLGTVEALPLTTVGALIDGGLTYLTCH